MSVETKLVLICMAAVAGAFVLAYFRVLGTWCEHHIQRHDLIVRSKQKRLDYYKALAERNKAAVEEAVVVEPEQAQTPEPELELARAA